MTCTEGKWASAKLRSNTSQKEKGIAKQNLYPAKTQQERKPERRDSLTTYDS
jgi:hypothetical protein